MTRWNRLPSKKSAFLNPQNDRLTCLEFLCGNDMDFVRSRNPFLEPGIGLVIDADPGIFPAPIETETDEIKTALRCGLYADIPRTKSGRIMDCSARIGH